MYLSTNTIRHSLAVTLCFLAADLSIAQEQIPAEVPTVLLSKQHEALCKVKVGDTLPSIELPRVDNGKSERLSDLLTEQPTVVVFWSANRRMSHEQLADIGPDVIQPFADQGVSVVGIGVNVSAADARDALQKAKADFPNLIDVDGKAFATVGSERLPRTYLVDGQGKILWFDIEYSHATRRELNQALRAVTARK